MSNAKGGKVESCSRIKDENVRLTQGKGEMQKIWKEYLEYLYNIDTQEHVALHMCGFNGIWRGNTSEESQLEELSGQAQEWKGCR